MDRGKHDKGGRPASKTGSGRNRKMTASVAVVYTLFVLGVSLLLASIVIVVANDVFAFVKKDQIISVSIKQNATIKEVAQQLDEKGVINYGSLFSLFTSLTTKEIEFVDGIYELNSKMDYRAILASLRRTDGTKTVVTLTIPEGYTVEQITKMLVEKKVCKSEALTEALANYDFDYDFLEGVPAGEANRLEGFLFPDTYQFYEGENAVSVVRRMLVNFQNKFTQSMREQAEDMDYSIRDIVIIASLIEREAKVDEDRAKISGVILNRLHNSSQYPYLNIDATILYDIGHKDALTTADLETDSPYNTYTNKGLPPGPIACPGYDSLYAALHPEEHEYYFYVAKKDGSHVFTKTLEEHNAARAQIASES